MKRKDTKAMLGALLSLSLLLPQAADTADSAPDRGSSRFGFNLVITNLQPARFDEQAFYRPKQNERSFSWPDRPGFSNNPQLPTEAACRLEKRRIVTSEWGSCEEV